MNLTLPQNTQQRTTKEHDRPHHTSTFFACMYKNIFSACACLCRPHASRVHHVSLRLLYYIKAHAKPFGLLRWRHSQNRTDGSPQNRIKSQGAFDNERNEENSSSLNDCITLSSTPFPLSPSLPLDISLNPERTEDFISSSICNQHQTRDDTFDHLVQSHLCHQLECLSAQCIMGRSSELSGIMKRIVRARSRSNARRLRCQAFCLMWFSL